MQVRRLPNLWRRRRLGKGGVRVTSPEPQVTQQQRGEPDRASACRNTCRNERPLIRVQGLWMICGVVDAIVRARDTDAVPPTKLRKKPISPA